MHAIEKLLAEKAGKHQVATGEIVNCDVDIAGINDLYLQTCLLYTSDAADD